MEIMIIIQKRCRKEVNVDGQNSWIKDVGGRNLKTERKSALTHFKLSCGPNHSFYK